MMTREQVLEAKYPLIPWRQPMPVTVVPGPIRAEVCRYCVAIHGLKASEVGSRGFASDEEFAEHLRSVHGIES